MAAIYNLIFWILISSFIENIKHYTNQTITEISLFV